MDKEEKIKLTITDAKENVRVLLVEPGTNLRDALLVHKMTPYVGHFQRFNCQGMGICGSCKVWVKENGENWERRSCQIQCFQDMDIRLQ